MDKIRIETVGQRVSLWGECPVWHEGILYYVDIAGKAIVAIDPQTEIECVWNVGQKVGFLVPRTQGGLLWGGDDGLYFLDLKSGASQKIVDPESDKPDNRFNDGKCAPDGRLFAGTISLVRKTGDACLYALDSQLQLSQAFAPVTTSNGLAWSADGKLCYYIDTPTREVKVFDYHAESGKLENPRVAFGTTQLIDASPDGMTIDRDGMLWIAFCHGGCVKRIDPATGAELCHIALPALESTALTFGGPDFSDLYVTSGVHAKVPEVNGGRLFVIRGLPVGGYPAVPFAG